MLSCWVSKCGDSSRMRWCVDGARHFLGAGITRKLVTSASLLDTDSGPGRAAVNNTTMARKSRIQCNAALQQHDALPKQTYTYTRALFPRKHVHAANLSLCGAQAIKIDASW